MGCTFVRSWARRPHAQACFAVSEYLLTGITISIAASFVVGGWAGVSQGLHGIHSGAVLRTQAVCEIAWVIVVLGIQSRQVYLAYWEVGTKDFVLICVIFVLTLPSMSWIYSRSEAFAARRTARDPGAIE